MKCRLVEKYLSDYLDGLIPTKIKTEVEAHLAQCKSCAVKLESLQTLLKAINMSPRFTAPTGFVHRVNAGIDAALQAKPTKLELFRRRFAWRIPVMAGATLAAALLVVVFLQNNEHKPADNNKSYFIQAATSAHNEFIANDRTVIDHADNSEMTIVELGAM